MCRQIFEIILVKHTRDLIEILYYRHIHNKLIGVTGIYINCNKDINIPIYNIISGLLSDRVHKL